MSERVSVIVEVIIYNSFAFLATASCVAKLETNYVVFVKAITLQCVDDDS